MDARKILESIRSRNKQADELKVDTRKEIGNSLSLEQALLLAAKAMNICNKWSTNTANKYVPSVLEIESNETVRSEYNDDVNTTTGLLTQLAVAAQDPAIEPKLNLTLDGFRSALTEFLNTPDATTESNNLSANSLSANSPFPPPLNPTHSATVWDPTNSFTDLPAYLNGDHIMGVSIQTLIKLGVAMQGVLALQDKALSDLGDKIAFLNKVQAAYTEIADYYASGNPSPIPQPTPPGSQGNAIHDPIWTVDLVDGTFPNSKAFLPTLGDMLKQAGWHGGDGATGSQGTPPNDLSIADAFSHMNELARQKAIGIDTSLIANGAAGPFPAATSNTLTYFGTPDYFNPSGTPGGTNNFDGYVHLLSAGDANSSVRTIGGVTSTGSSVSQKATATLQSTQTNYNNVWGFVSSFIKDLSQSLQTIAQS